MIETATKTCLHRGVSSPFCPRCGAEMQEEPIYGLRKHVAEMTQKKQGRDSRVAETIRSIKSKEGATTHVKEISATHASSVERTRMWAGYLAALDDLIHIARSANS